MLVHFRVFLIKMKFVVNESAPEKMLRNVKSEHHMPIKDKTACFSMSVLVSTCWCLQAFDFLCPSDL